MAILLTVKCEDCGAVISAQHPVTDAIFGRMDDAESAGRDCYQMQVVTSNDCVGMDTLITKWDMCKKCYDEEFDQDNDDVADDSWQEHEAEIAKEWEEQQIMDYLWVELKAQKAQGAISEADFESQKQILIEWGF